MGARCVLTIAAKVLLRVLFLRLWHKPPAPSGVELEMVLGCHVQHARLVCQRRGELMPLDAQRMGVVLDAAHFGSARNGGCGSTSVGTQYLGLF